MSNSNVQNFKGTIKHWFPYRDRVRGVMKTSGGWKVITTSKVMDLSREEQVVVTESGSKYLLVNEINTDDNVEMCKYWPCFGGTPE